MINMPKDLRERSLNTQIQYLIIFSFWVYVKILTVVAGIAFLWTSFTGLYILLEDVLVIAGIFLLISVVIIWYKNEKEYRDDLKKLRALEDAVNDIKAEFEREAKEDYLSGKIKKLKKIVEVSYLGKTKSIGVEFIPIKDIPYDEQLKKVLDDAFDGLVISTRPFQQEPETNENTAQESERA